MSNVSIAPLSAEKNVSMRTLAERNKVDVLRKSDGFHVSINFLVEKDGFNPRDYGSARTMEHIDNVAKAYANGDYVEPITVRVIGETISPVDGHCRLHAAHLAVTKYGATLTHLPVSVFEGTDVEAKLHVINSGNSLEISAIETARHYRSLIKEDGLTQAQLANEIRRTQGHVSQMLKLLELPEGIQQMIESDAVSATTVMTYVRERTTAYMEVDANANKKSVVQQVYADLEDDLKSALSATSEGDNAPEAASQPASAAPAQEAPKKTRVTTKKLSGEGRKKKMSGQKKRDMIQRLENIAEAFDIAPSATIDGKTTATVEAGAWDELLTILGDLKAGESEKDTKTIPMAI